MMRCVDISCMAAHIDIHKCLTLKFALDEIVFVLYSTDVDLIKSSDISHSMYIAICRKESKNQDCRNFCVRCRQYQVTMWFSVKSLTR